MPDFQVIHNDCLLALREMEEHSVDAIVTDPPYGLSFMGKDWDHGVPGVAFWLEALRVLKPGGHMLAFSGSRTYHRLACAIEDAGFEIRDQIMWLYGSGFPKSLDVSKAIDKAAGAERTEVIGKSARHGGGIVGAGTSYEVSPEVPMLYAPATDAARQWDGWGTALKPAHEPIVVARKPLEGTVAANVLKWGTGALNIDDCRVGWPGGVVPEIGTPGWGGPSKKLTAVPGQEGETVERAGPSQLGRWPANVIHDGSEEVLSGFPDAKGQQGAITGAERSSKTANTFGEFAGRSASVPRGDTGSAARFFYCAKASKKDRDAGNTHATVKPTDLMRYLVRLVTPPDGLVLDPFCGSGSTGKAAMLEGFNFIGIEREAEYVEIARARIAAAVKPRPVPAKSPDKPAKAAIEEISLLDYMEGARP